MTELRTRAETLERRLAEIEQEARARVTRAELKVEALRAGIVDLDGLKLLDLRNVELTSDGELANAAELMAQLRRAKPWLFGGASSSSPSSPPPVQPPRQKLATEMTDDEYRAARAAILKHQS
ncbi:MAG TPA: hypothetical protein VKI44_00490 [Acetobacteraceae bacterium]|nr:hypothetical protein [Acetobacteraceae bacterium]